MENVWRLGDFTGDNAPKARVLVQRANMRLTGTRDYGDFASLIFGAGEASLAYLTPREVPNIKSVQWNRSVDQSVADCTIEIWNTYEDPATGQSIRGYYSWNRGSNPFDKHRRITKNDWFGWLIPDNIIKTFEGYGADYTKVPEADPNIILTGTWLIDDVINNGSVITLKCRDFGRLLLEQIFYPPIVPRKSRIEGIQYPIFFDAYSKVPNTPSVSTTPVALRFADSSSTPYVGQAGYQSGHYAEQAFDGNPATYWLSPGNGSPNAPYSYEWIEGSCKGQSVSQVQFRPWACYMRGWVSVYANGAWVNKVGVIPYDPHNPNSAPNGADIPAVATFNCGADNEVVTVNFPAIPGATLVRVTFTNLQDSGIGPYVYRAGVRELNAYATVTKPGGYTVNGNYGDYSDIIKLVLAWAGFHWPKDMPFVFLSSGIAIPLQASIPNDTFLKEGRIWGDIELTGTYGVAPLPFTDFDKQPLMQAITEVQDIIQFLFMVDENGGAVWRAPNIWELGNLINGMRQKRFLSILDTQTLTDITNTLSGRNWRERVYVSDPTGKIAGGARGYNLNPIGMRRVAGWSDMHFDNPAEAQRTAQLIAVRQMMSTNTNTFAMPGLPTMQCDDQVQLIDSTVGEGYVEYIQSISSKLDHMTGEYVFTVTSQWLGVRPGDDWIIDQYGNMSGDVKAFLDASDYGRRDGVYNGFPPVVLS